MLAKPVGVSVDASGNLYVADANNRRIRQISAGGAISTVIGSGDRGFGADGGPATSAILTVHGVGTDASGNLLVADTRNQRLRRMACQASAEAVLFWPCCCCPPSDGVEGRRVEACDRSGSVGVGGFRCAAGGPDRLRRLHRVLWPGAKELHSECDCNRDRQHRRHSDAQHICCDQRAVKLPVKTLDAQVRRVQSDWTIS